MVVALPPTTSDPVLPTVREIVRRIVPQAIEASVVPAVIVLVVSNLASGMVAIAAALAWTLLAATWRTVSGGQLTGLSILALTRLSARSVIALAAGSTFLYFFQGSIGGLCLGTAFLVSVAIGKPLARRFAEDFTQLPRPVLDQPHVRQALSRISLLWGVVVLAHTSVALWLLVHLPMNAYIVVNTALAGVVPATLIAISVTWFRRVMSTAHDPRAFAAPALTPAGT